MNPVDPRERLVVLGNELLEAVCAEEEFTRRYKDALTLMRAKDVNGISAMLPGEELVKFMLGAIQLPSDRKQLTEKYFELRETIAALTAPRGDLP